MRVNLPAFGEKTTVNQFRTLTGIYLSLFYQMRAGCMCILTRERETRLKFSRICVCVDLSFGNLFDNNICAAGRDFFTIYYYNELFFALEIYDSFRNFTQRNDDNNTQFTK